MYWRVFVKVAIIPARGGSKRIKRKNIKTFVDEPIIAKSIITAKKANIFDSVIVSTDDDEIKDVALSYGAEVPFLRPKELSDDYTPTIPVIKHAINQINATGENKVTFVCCIYPTAPFLLVEDLQSAYVKLSSDSAIDYVFPVVEYNYPIQRALRININNSLSMFYPGNYDKRSQDLEKSYHDAGQFYWGRAESWLNETPIFNGNSASVIMPRLRVMDIDTYEDWVLAEFMYKCNSLFITPELLNPN